MKSDGDPYTGPQAAQWARGQCDVATVCSGDIACNGETKTRTALVLIARLVKPKERSEYVFSMFWPNARAIVVNIDVDETCVAYERERHALPVPLGIGNKIAYATLEGQRAHSYKGVTMSL